jgi:hypothetical protein
MVASPRPASQASTPEGRIQADLVDIVKGCEQQLRVATIAIGGLCLLGVVIIWVAMPFRQSPGHLGGAVAMTFGCLILCGMIALGLDNAIVSFAAAQFNLRFPQGTARRPVALEMLASLHSPHQAAQKIQTRLGLAPGTQVSPEAQLQAGLDQLEPTPTVPTAVGPAVPQDPSPLHLGPSASSSGPPDKGDPDYIPLEVKEQPANEALPQPLDSTRFQFVPLQPLEKPGDDEPPQTGG